MQFKRIFTSFMAIIILTLTTLACNLTNDGPPSNAIEIEIVANTSLTPWLQEAIVKFNEAKLETSGRPVYAVLNPLEAGQAVTDIVSGKPTPELWIPDSEVWVNILAERGRLDYQGNCVSIAESPLVIAMWRPIAESLGWPGRSLGWLDIGSLAADPSAWAYYSGGQFGANLRMGHTHPGLSGTGAGTLLAIVQAAELKSEAVSVTDIQQPLVRASVSAFEGTVAWFSPSTDNLGQTMRQRGPDYLGAAVMYESTVINYSDGTPNIVPIYPFEGTFMATHPACIHTAAPDIMKKATEIFRNYLLADEAQQLALTNGLRPVNEQVTLGAPLDVAHGVDLNQPEIVFSAPTVNTIYAIQDLWQAARKDVNLVMLLDISGSMRDDKIENMRGAAIQFVEQMGDDDFITIVAFSKEPILFIDHEQVGTARPQVLSIITDLYAGGDTALYDAIGLGGNLIADSTSSQATNVMVVLTDGQDTNSTNFHFNQHLIDTATANDTTVFTIAYGGDAEEDLLSNLAQQANGNFYLGTKANIDEIYQEMSAAFGGNVGIGR
ncbi:VWA domain-containing protein [Anaerolineales bacterium HSG24]|nr:VWA domain-containing protein [Anaerolineales bacterium HSG24]